MNIALLKTVFKVPTLTGSPWLWTKLWESLLCYRAAFFGQFFIGPWWALPVFLILRHSCPTANV
jgi:hypothetical protein